MDKSAQKKIVETVSAVYPPVALEWTSSGKHSIPMTSLRTDPCRVSVRNGCSTPNYVHPEFVRI